MQIVSSLGIQGTDNMIKMQVFYWLLIDVYMALGATKIYVLKSMAFLPVIVYNVDNLLGFVLFLEDNSD